MCAAHLIFAVHAILTTMYKPINPEHRLLHCLECGEPVYGRADKKFCSNVCRNSFHSHIRSEERQKRHLTMTLLAANYGILQNLLRIKKTSCPMDSLLDMGFLPNYVTRMGEKKGRHTEYRCFDIAYFQTSGKIFNLHKV